MEPDLMNRPVNRSLLQSLGKHGRWSEDTAKQAFYESGIYADRKQWLSWAVRFFAGTGIAFLLAGIIFFFAWNWSDMSRVMKFSTVGGSLVIVTLASLFLRKKHELAFQLGLTVVMVLTGLLFAVQGQEYQTGADDYVLFRNWSVAVLLIVAVSCFPPLWLLYAVLLNVTLILWNAQTQERGAHWLLTYLFILNTLILLAWEFLQGFKIAFVKGRWFPRILATAAVLCSTITLMSERLQHDWISAAIMLPLYVAGGLVYGLYRKDLFMLGLLGFSTLLLLADQLPHERGMDAQYISMLLRGIIILGGSSLLAVGLVKLNKKWKHEQQ